ncbi:hypothetical protein HYV82_04725 [Candidatus Woesearchaeota archaeon]|nr:hypothetical protein [Candidatus Woesearchaeota archaeon]
MGSMEDLKMFEERLNKELTDLLNEEEAIHARRRLFMESEAVREHLEQHKSSDATLIFGFSSEDEKKANKGKEGIEAITADAEDGWQWRTAQQKKEEDKKFLGYEANKQQAQGQGFVGYGSNAGGEKGFGGYASAGQEQLASASYSQGKDTAWCSDCGCGFNRAGSGEVMQDPAIPGHEAASSGKGYGAVGKSSAAGQGYSASGSSKLSYGIGSSSSSKANYGH